MWPRSYAELLRRAQERLSSIEHTSIDSRFGTIEYAERGEGHPVLVLHGIFGGFDAACLTADRWIGDGFHVVAPSRFGCLGSPLPPDATAADQADAYAVLLDALGIGRAAVVGFSAGTVSAMQFGLRHPDRITALVLMSGHYPQKHHKLPELPLRLLYTDRAFWMLKTFAPELFARVCGTPKGFRASPGEQRALRSVMEGLFPITPRRQGAIFDTLVSEPDVDNFPLEQISAHAPDPRRGRRARPLCDRATGGRPDPGGAVGDDPERRSPVPGCRSARAPGSRRFHPCTHLSGGAPRTMTRVGHRTALKRGSGRPPWRRRAPSRP
jgi:pimeloyl-ACP methyl ester carboxylesterase